MKPSYYNVLALLASALHYIPKVGTVADGGFVPDENHPQTQLARRIEDALEESRGAANRNLLVHFVADFERSHFRTVSDTGANPDAMRLWNLVRHRAGLPMIGIEDLPAYNENAGKYVLPKDSKLTGKPIPPL